MTRTVVRQVSLAAVFILGAAACGADGERNTDLGTDPVCVDYCRAAGSCVEQRSIDDLNRIYSPDTAVCEWGDRDQAIRQCAIACEAAGFSSDCTACRTSNLGVSCDGQGWANCGPECPRSRFEVVPDVGTPICWPSNASPNPGRCEVGTNQMPLRVLNMVSMPISYTGTATVTSLRQLTFTTTSSPALEFTFEGVPDGMFERGETVQLRVEQECPFWCGWWITVLDPTNSDVRLALWGGPVPRISRVTLGMVPAPCGTVPDLCGSRAMLDLTVAIGNDAARIEPGTAEMVGRWEVGNGASSAIVDWMCTDTPLQTATGYIIDRN